MARRVRQLRTNLPGASQWLAYARKVGGGLVRKGKRQVVAGLLIVGNRKTGKVDVLDLPHKLLVAGARIWPPLQGQIEPLERYLAPYAMGGTFPTRLAAGSRPDTAREIPGVYSADEQPTQETLDLMESYRREYNIRHVQLGNWRCQYPSAVEFFQCASSRCSAYTKFMWTYPDEDPVPTYYVMTEPPLAAKFWGIEIELAGAGAHALRVSITEEYIASVTGGWLLFPPNVPYYNITGGPRVILTPQQPHVACDYDGAQLCFVTSVIWADQGQLDYGRRAILVGWADIPPSVNPEAEDFDLADLDVQLTVHEFPAGAENYFAQSQWFYPEYEGVDFNGWRPSFVRGSVAITGPREAVYHGRFISFTQGVIDSLSPMDTIPPSLDRATIICTSFRLGLPLGTWDVFKRSLLDNVPDASPAFEASVVLNAYTPADDERYREYVYWSLTESSFSPDGDRVTWAVCANRTGYFATASSAYIVPSVMGNQILYNPPGLDGAAGISDKSWFSIVRNGVVVYDERNTRYRATGHPFEYGIDYNVATTLGNMLFAGTTYGVRHGGPHAACHLSEDGEFGVTFPLFDVESRVWRLGKWDSIGGFDLWDVDLSGLPDYPLLDRDDYLFVGPPAPTEVTVTCHRRQGVLVEDGQPVATGDPAFILTMDSPEQGTWLVSAGQIQKLGPFSGAMATPAGNALTPLAGANDLYEG